MTPFCRISRRCQIAILIAICSVAGCGAKSPPPDPDAIHEDIRKIITAVGNNDAKTVVSFSHPKLVTALGGEQAAVTRLTAELEKFTASGFKFESVEFPEPPRFVESEENEFVIVRTRMMAVVGKQRVEGFGFQLGARTKGEVAWKYVDGAKLAGPALKMFFPDFPANEKLPEVVLNPL